MKVRMISRAAPEHVRERPGDLYVVNKNPNPALHPFEREREFVRALNATKLDRVFAKPFLAALSGHFDGVCSMTKHPTHLSLLLSGDFSGELRLWNIATHTCLGRIQAHSGYVTGSCFCYTGTTGTRAPTTVYTCGSDRTVKSWRFPFDFNEAIRPLSTSFADHSFTGIDHNRYNTMFATSGGNVVALWDEERNAEPIHEYDWGTESVHCVRFNPIESHVLASSAGDRSIALYDVRMEGQAPTALRKVVLRSRANAIAWNPMEAFNITAACDDGNLYSFDVRKLTTARVVHEDHLAAVMDVDYSPTGKEFVTGSFDRTIRIFDADATHSKEVYHTKRMQRVMNVRYSSDARYVISGSDDANIRLWKAKASAPIKVLSTREKQAQMYKDKLKQRFANVPQIKRIATWRRVPKNLLSTRRKLGAIRKAIANKQENVKKHSRPGSVVFQTKQHESIVAIKE